MSGDHDELTAWYAYMFLSIWFWYLKTCSQGNFNTSNKTSKKEKETGFDDPCEIYYLNLKSTCNISTVDSTQKD